MDEIICEYTWEDGSKLMVRSLNQNGCTSYHTLDVIPRKWYTKTELRHGTSKWDILCEGFLSTFIFEDQWMDTMDDALQLVKTAIFRTPP